MRVDISLPLVDQHPEDSPMALSRWDMVNRMPGISSPIWDNLMVDNRRISLRMLDKGMADSRIPCILSRQVDKGMGGISLPNMEGNLLEDSREGISLLPQVRQVFPKHP